MAEKRRIQDAGRAVDLRTGRNQGSEGGSAMLHCGQAPRLQVRPMGLAGWMACGDTVPPLLLWNAMVSAPTSRSASSGEATTA